MPQAPGTTAFRFGKLASFLAAIVMCASVVDAQPFQVPRLSGSTSDHRDGDWNQQGLRIGILSRLSHVGVQEDPTGQAELRLGWDPEGLLVLVRVQDTARIESSSGSLYRGDSVEVFLAPAAGSKSLVQVVASPGIAGSKYPGVRSLTVTHGDYDKATQAVQVAGGSIAKGWWLQVRIGWAGLGLTPRVGSDVGVQVIINNRDLPFADTGDMAKRVNQIEHFCFFPDRTTSFDPTRMNTVRLSLEAGQSVLAHPALDLSPTPARLTVQTVGEFAGRTLAVRQGPTLLGQAALAGRDSAHLCTAVIPLPDLDVHGPPLELLAGKQPVGRVPLYRMRSPEQQQLIDSALNTADEKHRLSLMRSLQAAAADDPQLQQDIQVLLPLVEQWATGRQIAEAGGLDEPAAYLNFGVNPMSPPPLRRDSPLYPLYALYRARNLIWYAIANGSTEERPRYISLARRLLQEASSAAPHNPIIGMYLDRPIAWAGPRRDANAPAWANDQREAIAKLRQIIHWWIDQRQLSSGAFGGGWEDDCEMWRNWLPVLMAFEDHKVEVAEEKFCRGALAQADMAAGYTAVLKDVEHSSEVSADTLTPMLHLHPGSSEWGAQAKRLAELMRHVWTGTNQRGQLMFKNIMFSARQVATDPKRAYDTTLDARAIQPALVYWQQTQDPQLTAILGPWLDTWVDATARADNGKPAGIVPSAIHWPDGTVGNPNGDWWQIQSYSQLYDWPCYVSDMLHVMLMAYQATGQDKYLEPIRSMARIRAAYLKHPVGTEVQTDTAIVFFGSLGGSVKIDPSLKPGSQPWCAAQMAPMLSGALMGYRLLTGDRQFDDVLRHDANGYGRYLLDGDRQAVASELKAAAVAFARNEPGFTSEVRFTDRAFRLIPWYFNTLPASACPVPNARLVYATATGDPTTWQGCRLAAVRWHTPPQDIAALVTQPGPAAFQAELYHFGPQPRTLDAELFRLRKGRYTLTLDTRQPAANVSLLKETLEVTGPGVQVHLTLPSRQLCVLTVTPG
jgi:hypothetical protein